MDATSLLASQRTSSGLEVNKAIGSTAAVFLRDVVNGRAVETHVPGPFGLPGGYPVRVAGAHMELNLPADLSEREAITWNEKIALADGVKILSNGNVEFGEETRLALRQCLPRISNGFHVGEVDKITQSMLELRESLTREKRNRSRPEILEV